MKLSPFLLSIPQNIYTFNYISIASTKISPNISEIQSKEDANLSKMQHEKSFLSLSPNLPN
jgi:hypothetical protein